MGAPPPPSGETLQTKVTIVGKNEIYNRENLVGPFLVHNLLDSTGYVCPARPASKRMFQPSITVLYPRTSLPPLAQEPQAQAHCMTVGDQLNSHFFVQQMGRSHAPYPCRPHHGHPPQNQRIPLLCVTDHSSGHTKESLTPTGGATTKRGKTLSSVPSMCVVR